MDRIEQIKGSQIQHGKHNDRIYLMKLNTEHLSSLVGELMFLGEVNQYGKVFAKVPASEADVFVRNGYVKEARIPGYYNGVEDACLMSRFLKPERADDEDKQEIEAVLARATAEKNSDLNPLATDYELRECTENDLEVMAQLYAKVFPSYPFPIQDPEYLREAMQDDVRFFGVWRAGQLVALASAECDPDSRAAEMTDFATDPSERGNGLASHLLLTMEKSLQDDDFVTVYTIARAMSTGMNRVFSSADYTFNGTLVNNTQIMGRMESMNVWSKKLS